MVSHEEHASWLIEIATGWLGWAPGIAERTDCCRILLGYQGKLDMLRTIYGSGDKVEPEQTKPELPPLTPAALREMGKR